MQPEFRVIALDRSHTYRDKLVEKCGGKIWETYFYDASRIYHIFETTDLYELHFVEAFPDTSSVYLQEDIDEELREANLYSGEMPIYIEAIHIDSIPLGSDTHKKVVWSIDPEETYEEVFESAYEYVRCNTII